MFNCNHKFLGLLAFILFIPFSVQAEIIKEERSLYRNIIVEDKGDIRCLKFSVKRLKTSQSCIDKTKPKALVFDYTKYVMSSLLFNPSPKKVLIIGLGGGTLSNSLLELFPDVEIDNVEIDPAVIRVAKQYFDFKTSDKVRSHTQDGRIFIKRAKRKNQQYDLIILDAFNGEYIPEHLLTKEFLEETQSLLTDNGVLVANTFSSSKLYHHETATYHAVFGDFYSLQKGYNKGNRVIMLPKIKPTNVELSERLIKLEPRLADYNIKLTNMLAFLEIEQLPDEEYKVLTDQYSPANLL
ncbi:fused MFS/spermidine synthase [Thalassotalea psychrophila]|uniref:Polyamine aminopropyltransferase n=1 Tax=Thalassotalea psychrophila TaxID=3065647 RepID=A0ABY9TU05_9GAMM|nr:fused MFS/spermidine synthase [Colwelliaceae bacterium SQ149]